MLQIRCKNGDRFGTDLTKSECQLHIRRNFHNHNMDFLYMSLLLQNGYTKTKTICFFLFKVSTQHTFSVMSTDIFIGHRTYEDRFQFINDFAFKFRSKKYIL